MPALRQTRIMAAITWLGRVPDRAASLRAEALAEVFASFAGVAGEDHAGLTRPACSRVTALYPRDTEIRNVRQFSVVSAEDLALVAQKMGIAVLDPALIGASMVISGIPDFSHVPPSSRLQAAGGAVLVVDMENLPCNLPAKVIDEDLPGFGRAFKAAARGRRGVTAWVEREGRLAVGDAMTLHIPDQPVWPHLAAARAG